MQYLYLARSFGFFAVGCESETCIVIQNDLKSGRVRYSKPLARPLAPYCLLAPLTRFQARGKLEYLTCKVFRITVPRA